jgi:rhodanese-related sulfurtransferase
MKVLTEGLIVAACGVCLALLANAVSPRGLRLNRNYFPGSTATPVAGSVAASTNQGQTSGVTNAGPATSALELRLQAEGISLATGATVRQLLDDPRLAQGLVLIIDARDDEAYQKGHIPGSWQLDHYHPEKYLPAVYPLCQNAQQIIVYCNGGDCEDSVFTAVVLREAGIPREKLFVFGGGITEWNANHWPVEIGQRGSGQVQSASK